MTHYPRKSPIDPPNYQRTIAQSWLDRHVKPVSADEIPDEPTPEFYRALGAQYARGAYPQLLSKSELHDINETINEVVGQHLYNAKHRRDMLEVSRAAETIDPTRDTRSAARAAQAFSALAKEVGRGPIMVKGNGNGHEPLSDFATGAMDPCSLADKIMANNGNATIEELIRCGLSLAECVKLQDEGYIRSFAHKDGTTRFVLSVKKVPTMPEMATILGVLDEAYRSGENQLDALAALGLNQEQMEALVTLGVVRSKYGDMPRKKPAL